MSYNKPLKPLEFMALAALLRCPLHGYGVRQEIILFSGQRMRGIAATTVQRALRTLAQAGYIQDCTDPNYWVSRRRIQAYELTSQGRHRLLRELDLYQHIIDSCHKELTAIQRRPQLTGR